MNKRKVIPSLRSLADQERATAKKARASWQMFTIMAEFIEATEYLSEIRPAVSIYGSARLKPEIALLQTRHRRSRDDSPTRASPSSPAAVPASWKRPTKARMRASRRRSA